jgi:hypothetical protein
MRGNSSRDHGLKNLEIPHAIDWRHFVTVSHTMNPQGLLAQLLYFRLLRL